MYPTDEGKSSCHSPHSSARGCLRGLILSASIEDPDHSEKGTSRPPQATTVDVDYGSGGSLVEFGLWGRLVQVETKMRLVADIRGLGCYVQYLVVVLRGYFVGSKASWSQLRTPGRTSLGRCCCRSATREWRFNEDRSRRIAMKAAYLDNRWECSVGHRDTVACLWSMLSGQGSESVCSPCTLTSLRAPQVWKRAACV